MSERSSPIHIHYLNGPDVEQVALTDDEILAAIEGQLRAQGEGRAVIGARTHLMTDSAFNGHFNVLRGYVAPLNLAGVKVVGDFVDNYKVGLPSEMAMLNLFDPRTGMPVAIIDATWITDARTGAVTALGGKYLGPQNAPKKSLTLGHIGGLAPGETHTDAEDCVDQAGRARDALRHDERGGRFTDRRDG